MSLRAPRDPNVMKLGELRTEIAAILAAGLVRALAPAAASALESDAAPGREPFMPAYKENAMTEPHEPDPETIDELLHDALAQAQDAQAGIIYIQEGYFENREALPAVYPDCDDESAEECNHLLEVARVSALLSLMALELCIHAVESRRDVHRVNGSLAHAPLREPPWFPEEISETARCVMSAAKASLLTCTSDELEPQPEFGGLPPSELSEDQPDTPE